MDHLRSSPVTGIELSTSSIASFEPGSIVLRSPSVFVIPSGSRVVHLRLIPKFPHFSLVFTTPLDFQRFLSTYVASLESPRFLDFPRFSLAFATSLEYPRFLDFWRFLSTCVVSLDFPRFRRSSGHLSARAFFDQRDQASIPRIYDLPRLSRWSYIIIEFFCVTRLNLSGLN